MFASVFEVWTHDWEKLKSFLEYAFLSFNLKNLQSFFVRDSSFKFKVLENRK